jgi:SAM-dependent methyltransferase
MGIDYVSFERLCELSTRFAPQGRCLMLGRQKFQIQSPYARHYDRALRRHGRETTRRFDYLQEDGFSENLFAKLGFATIETMDFSDYEGATILQDLNRPIPEALAGQFDFIYDGGTIEHVFNVPMALENVFRLLKTGGRFVSLNGLNGWQGHGIYQFNPELVWTYWQRTAGCKVHACNAIHQNPTIRKAPIAMPDPALSGVRLRLRDLPEGRVYLQYEVEKTPEAALGQITLQSDYETKWQGNTTATPTRFDQVAE